jgi:hypothetical protein
MAYLYHEVPGARSTELERHLRSCGECRTALAQWRSAVTSLRQWDLPEHRPTVPVRFVEPALRWALAALVVLGLGYGIGRFSAPSPDMAALRAAIEKPLRDSLLAEVQQQVRTSLTADWEAVRGAEKAAVTNALQRQLGSRLQEWRAETVAALSEDQQRLFDDFFATYRTERQQDRQMLLTLFDRAEEKHQAQHLSLRRAVETVAVVAADRLQRTETQLGELASFTEARFVPDNAKPLERINPSELEQN